MIQSQIRAMERAVQPADLALLELATENAELRLQLAEAQDQCIEMAVDAGELQAEIDALRGELASLQGRSEESLVLHEDKAPEKPY